MHNRQYFDNFPYRVSVERDANWYTSTWREYSTWCNECIGIADWEFINREFLFKTKEDMMMFTLRWKTR